MSNSTGAPSTPSGPHPSFGAEDAVQFIPIEGGPTPASPAGAGTNVHTQEPLPTPTNQTPGAGEF